MTNGCIVVDKIAWERMTASEQSYLIDDTLQSQDRRIKKLEQWLRSASPLIFSGQ